MNLDFILRYEIGSLMIFIIAFLFARYMFQINGQDKAIFALNATFPNYGFMGIPLIFLLFGSEAAIPVALILVFDAIILLTLVSLFSSFESDEPVHSNLKVAFRGLTTNPLLLSALAGFIFSIAGLELGKLPKTTFDILAGAAAPTALFALGINLVETPSAKDIGEITFLAFTKLVVHPLLVLSLFFFWPAAGETSVPDMWIGVAVILASLPIAANAYALADYYNSYTHKTSAAIFVSTVFACLTLPAFIYLASKDF